jgi:maltose O-acetyltransferase
LKRLLNSIKRFYSALMLTIAGSPFVTYKSRINIYRRQGIKIGKNVVIRPHCVFDDINKGFKLTIGDDCIINSGCLFSSVDSISIGDRVGLGYNVTVVSSTREIGGKYFRVGPTRRLPVEIGSGCMIGSCVLIMPGVKIEEGCVICAGAVVVKDCEKNGVYMGVPAVRKRDLSDE